MKRKFQISLKKKLSEKMSLKKNCWGKIFVRKKLLEKEITLGKKMLEKEISLKKKILSQILYLILSQTDSNQK